VGKGKCNNEIKSSDEKFISAAAVAIDRLIIKKKYSEPVFAAGF